MLHDQTPSKTKSKSTFKSKSPAKAGPVRVARLDVRMTPEYREWLSRLAEAQRLTVAQVLDQGAAMLAAARGFPPPPPR